jgi:hypothetical protein
VFPDQNLAIALRGRYEFTAVNAVRCAVAPNSSGGCPDGQQIAGGAGRVLGGVLQLLWHSEDQHKILTAEVATDYGVTTNLVPAQRGVAASSQDVGNSNFRAMINGRWIVSRGFSAFARYTYMQQFNDPPGWPLEFIRHVILLGFTVSATAGEANFLDGVVPQEEFATAAAIREAGAHSSQQSEGSEESNDSQEASPLDEPTTTEEPHQETWEEAERRRQLRYTGRPVEDAEYNHRDGGTSDTTPQQIPPRSEGGQ